MFCKYCGKALSGTVCNACGAETVLKKRSNDLDLLMHKPSGVAAPTASAPKKTLPVNPVAVPDSRRVSEGTSREQIDAAWRKGLEEGMKRSSASLPPRRKKAGRIAALCTAAMLLGAAAGGFLIGSVSYRNGFSRGEQQGAESARKDAEAEYGSMLEACRHEAYDEGRINGLVLGGVVSGASYTSGIPFAAESQMTEPVSETGPEAFSVQAEVPRFPYSQKRDHGVEDPFVGRIQERLAELGYYSDRIDGRYGPNTKAAVMAFQRDSGISKPSGEVDQATWNLLFPTPADVQPVPSDPPNAPETEPPASVTHDEIPEVPSEKSVSPLYLPPAPPSGRYFIPAIPLPSSTNLN